MPVPKVSVLERFDCKLKVCKYSLKEEKNNCNDQIRCFQNFLSKEKVEDIWTTTWRFCICSSPGLPSKRVMGMCRWMGSHFWTDYNGVTFLVELLEWGRKFSGVLG